MGSSDERRSEHVEPCEACDGEGEWFRYEGEGDAHTVTCDICNGTGCDQFGSPDSGQS